MNETLRRFCKRLHNPIQVILVCALPAHAGSGPAFSEDHLAGGCGTDCADAVAAVPAGLRIHAAAGRGRPALHALGIAGPVGGQGGAAVAANRSPIKTVPEVESVFGKAGPAEKANDPAPLELFETIIQFKPKAQWRASMTPDKLGKELDDIVNVPGLWNIWVPPIRNRIDMLATGIRARPG